MASKKQNNKSSPPKRAALSRPNKTGKRPHTVERKVQHWLAQHATRRQTRVRSTYPRAAVYEQHTIRGGIQNNPSREKAPTTTGRNPVRGSRKKGVKNPK